MDSEINTLSTGFLGVLTAKTLRIWKFLFKLNPVTIFFV